MKILIRFFLLLIASIPTLCFGENARNSFSDLSKKTAKGFIVPYVLRYDPDVWCRKMEDHQSEYRHMTSYLRFWISENENENNLTKDQVEEKFRKLMENNFSDSSMYCGIEIKPSENVLINGLEFIHQSAAIQLVPNIVHLIGFGCSDPMRTKIFKPGIVRRFENYSYNGENGRISFLFTTIGLSSEKQLKTEEKLAVDELFRGFSLDGSACCGPKKLRAIKTFADSLKSLSSH